MRRPLLPTPTSGTTQCSEIGGGNWGAEGEVVGHVEDFFDLPKIFIIGTLFCIFSGSIDSYVILMGRNYTAH